MAVPILQEQAAITDNARDLCEVSTLFSPSSHCQLAIEGQKKP